jgi:hypothetical protein
MRNEKVCFICGAPHSGSTLLGLILGSHSQCFYAGEANKVKFLHLENSHKDSTCKICGKDCPIWGDFYIDDIKDLYEQLSVKTHKPIIIDSTKKPSWLEKQIKNLEDRGVKSYLIYLFRDGRGVINSRLRKYKSSDPSEVIDDWITHIKKTNKIFQNFPEEKIKIQYKNLALNPEKTVKTLIDLLKIEFETSMINFYQFEHHPLGGNIGTQSLIIKAQKEKTTASPIKLSERNKYYYQDHPLQIKYDQRWKKELDPIILKLFDKKAGEFNKKLLKD